MANVVLFLNFIFEEAAALEGLYQKVTYPGNEVATSVAKGPLVGVL
jgi:hypothetical protein